MVKALPVVPTVCGAPMAPDDTPGPSPSLAVPRAALVSVATAGCFASGWFLKHLVVLNQTLCDSLLFSGADARKVPWCVTGLGITATVILFDESVGRASRWVVTNFFNAAVFEFGDIFCVVGSCR